MIRQLTLPILSLLGTSGICLAAFFSVIQPSRETTANAHARQTAAPASGPHQLVVSQGTLFDFGTMPSQTASVHEFELRNAGSSELTLQLLGTSCGCTTVRLDNRVMLPPPLEHLPPGYFPEPPVNPLSPAEMPAELLELLGGELVLAPQTASPETDDGESRSILKLAGDSLPFPSVSVPEGMDAIPLLAPTLEETIFRLAPGQTVRLAMEWRTGESEGPFQQTARLSTSDPNQSLLEFVIRGKVATIQAER